MNIIVKVFAIFVAIEFLFIMYLETFATTSDKTAKTFGMDKKELKRSSVNVLLKNLGIYNGLIGILILLSVFVFESQIAVMVLMGYIIIVAVYGSITSNPNIIFKQGGLAIITLVLSVVCSFIRI
ncbi:DUF1304 domain-containing protein [Peptostreptococcus porci]|uniref:DUF1304 domain-containing protein n=1 Tax=Peptostreptococcus porci TaxID=2652282 RepID=UPI002A8A1F43|nr:DUF1304 domain-containing protein [Peptostreptococcus porci]MDY4560923.1 DUF1304 domain-containing protein [Peptostreptococcus porci]MDY5437232.1 DUF1304 domain-containing protein [Peptostreptococcus porci]